MTGPANKSILAEAAMTLPVTVSGGVFFADTKQLQLPSSLIAMVILALFMRALAQRYNWANVE